MRNKLDDLRNHLFATLEGLLDEDRPMDLERAETVAKVAQVLVNSAKVEVQFLAATGISKATSFFPEPMLREPDRPKQQQLLN